LVTGQRQRAKGGVAIHMGCAVLNL
jgi:hypothetical protein